MFRLLVCCAAAGTLLLCTAPASAALTTVAEYNFDDASSLAPFTQTGSPVVSGGQLQLDGDSYLEIADPLGGVVDNFVVEAVVAATEFGPDPDGPGGIPIFDFAFARNDPAGPNGGNNGGGVLLQDFGAGLGQIKVLHSFCCATGGFGGGDTDPVQLSLNTPTALAWVVDGGIGKLYVNGVQILDIIDPGTIVGTPTTLGIGTHPFDGATGAFNGSIDRVRLSTFNPGEFMTSDLIPVPEPGGLMLACAALFCGFSASRRR